MQTPPSASPKASSSPRRRDACTFKIKRRRRHHIGTGEIIETSSRWTRLHLLLHVVVMLVPPRPAAIPFRMRVIGRVHQYAANDRNDAGAGHDVHLAYRQRAVHHQCADHRRNDQAAYRGSADGAPLGDGGVTLPSPMPVVDREVRSGRGSADADRNGGELADVMMVVVPASIRVWSREGNGRNSGNNDRKSMFHSWLPALSIRQRFCGLLRRSSRASAPLPTSLFTGR